MELESFLLALFSSFFVCYLSDCRYSLLIRKASKSSVSQEVRSLRFTLFAKKTCNLKKTYLRVFRNVFSLTTGCIEALRCSFKRPPFRDCAKYHGHSVSLLSLKIVRRVICNSTLFYFLLFANLFFS